MTKKLIVGLSGLAGSGKDFVANLLVEKHDFVKIALADPLKRICQEVFDFSDEQLWGPSEERNKPDKRYFTGEREGGILAYEDARILLTLEKMSNQEERTEPTHEEVLEACKIYLTPRFALQSLGTEWGRNCYPEVWTSYTMRVANKLLSGQGWRYSAKRGVCQLGVFNESDIGPEPDGVVISDVRFRNELEAVKNQGGKVVRIKREKPTTLSGSASKHSSEQEQKEILDSEFDYVLQNQEDLGALQQEIREMLVKLRA